MPPTETSRGGMLCLSRHENCPWDLALKEAKLNWSGLQYSCLKILHLYCKVFEREDVLEMVIRKTCKCCGCDRLSHAVYHEELASVRARLGLRDTRDARDTSRAEHPPTLTPAQSELYWSSLSERLPAGAGAAGGAAGWRAWRSRALAAQLPKQDLALAHCNHVDDAHKKQFEDFVAARNEIALDIGVASQHHGPSVECMSCTKPIRNGSIMVQAPRIGDEACFHPACFTCSECDELLVELAYCALDGRLYCVRHYGERLKPRCHACDEWDILISVVHIAPRRHTASLPVHSLPQNGDTAVGVRVVRRAEGGGGVHETHPERRGARLRRQLRRAGRVLHAAAAPDRQPARAARLDRRLRPGLRRLDRGRRRQAARRRHQVPRHAVQLYRPAVLHQDLELRPVFGRRRPPGEWRLRIEQIPPQQDENDHIGHGGVLQRRLEE